FRERGDSYAVLPHARCSSPSYANTRFFSLSLHDALPIFLKRSPTSLIDALTVFVFSSFGSAQLSLFCQFLRLRKELLCIFGDSQDRKSTRLNSSHVSISYAVFCLKKKSIITTKRKVLRMS